MKRVTGISMFHWVDGALAVSSAALVVYQLAL